MIFSLHLAFRIYTILAEPGTPPTNITTSNKTSQSITFVWEPPTVQNGIIVSYTFNYTIFNETLPRTLQKQTNATEITIGRLKPFQNLSVEVSGSTSIGMGPFSVPVVETTNQSSKITIH